MSDFEPRLDEILRFLNEKQIRATYSAVARVVGGSPQSIGGRLGDHRPEASWVVNTSTGLPSGYTLRQLHPRLFRTTSIIVSGVELFLQMAEWKDLLLG